MLSAALTGTVDFSTMILKPSSTVSEMSRAASSTYFRSAALPLPDVKSGGKMSSKSVHLSVISQRLASSKCFGGSVHRDEDQICFLDRLGDVGREEEIPTAALLHHLVEPGLVDGKLVRVPLLSGKIPLLQHSTLCRLSGISQFFTSILFADLSTTVTVMLGHLYAMIEQVGPPT